MLLNHEGWPITGLQFLCSNASINNWTEHFFINYFLKVGISYREKKEMMMPFTFYNVLGGGGGKQYRLNLTDTHDCTCTQNLFSFWWNDKSLRSCMCFRPIIAEGSGGGCWYAACSANNWLISCSHSNDSFTLPADSLLSNAHGGAGQRKWDAGLILFFFFFLKVASQSSVFRWAADTFSMLGWKLLICCNVNWNSWFSNQWEFVQRKLDKETCWFAE